MEGEYQGRALVTPIPLQCVPFVRLLEIHDHRLQPNILQPFRVAPWLLKYRFVGLVSQVTYRGMLA